MRKATMLRSSGDLSLVFFFFLITTLLEHAHIILVLRDELALSMSLRVHGGTFSLDKLRVSPRSRERGDTNA